jgi:hypothetical protein
MMQCTEYSHKAMRHRCAPIYVYHCYNTCRMPEVGNLELRTFWTHGAG